MRLAIVLLLALVAVVHAQSTLRECALSFSPNAAAYYKLNDTNSAESKLLDSFTNGVLFFPSDAAFSGRPGDYDTTYNTEARRLEVLRYSHTPGTRVLTSALAVNVFRTSLNGIRATLKNAGQTPFNGYASISTADRACGNNFYVNTVESMIYPPDQLSATIGVRAPSGSVTTSIAAVITASEPYKAIVNNATVRTFLAPTNTAFSATGLNETSLRYLCIEDEIVSTNFSTNPRQARTIDGYGVTFQKLGDNFVFTIGSVSTNVTVADTATTTAMIHVVDKNLFALLSPSDLVVAPPTTTTTTTTTTTAGPGTTTTQAPNNNNGASSTAVNGLLALALVALSAMAML